MQSMAKGNESATIKPITRSTTQSLLSRESGRPNKIACRVGTARTGRIECNILFKSRASEKSKRANENNSHHVYLYVRECFTKLSSADY